MSERSRSARTTGTKRVRRRRESAIESGARCVGSGSALWFGLIVLLACGHTPPSPVYSQASAAPPGSAQLDKPVAPIALYPDPLVAQILPASTYPVEVVEASRDLAGRGRPDRATASQWDPSIPALLSYSTVLKIMSDKINWSAAARGAARLACARRDQDHGRLHGLGKTAPRHHE